MPHRGRHDRTEKIVFSHETIDRGEGAERSKGREGTGFLLNDRSMLCGVTNGLDLDDVLDSQPLKQSDGEVL